MMKPSAHPRVQKHRDSLRAQGLRPIQIWVPDTRSAAFAAEARRQCQIINEAERDDETVDFFFANGVFFDGGDP